MPDPVQRNNFSKKKIHRYVIIFFLPVTPGFHLGNISGSWFGTEVIIR
jgi:hypothetical protein